MKILWLIRHAKSSWNDLNISDFDRPLNKRGNRDAPFMGKVLSEEKSPFDALISSPAKRAITTSEYLAEEIGMEKSEIVQNHMIYDANLQVLLELIYKLEDELNNVVMVGHNPGFTVLSDYLTDYYIDNIPTCGIVKIKFEIDSWREIIKGSGTMEYFKYPKKYNLD